MMLGFGQAWVSGGEALGLRVFDGGQEDEIPEFDLVR